MEGDNGSVGAHARVAAILQSLEDSGLVLTMSPALRDRGNRSPSPMGRHETKPIFPCYSVETNTDATNRTNTSRGAQICDDRYVSCYQVAHCRARPSSPPVVISEFPPQRAKPDHVDGNFEVGGVGSCDRRETRSRSPRNRLSCDRAATNGLTPSCETDPFALSLRQYPDYPPLKTVSSELLGRKQRDRSRSPSKTSSGQLREKILRRIQGKFSPLQNTQRTHSSLSFRKTKPSSRLRWNRSKHLLTHTYRFDSSKYRRPEKPSSFRREAEESTRNQKDFGTVTKLNEDLPKSDISTTYDYLKSPRLSPTVQFRPERKVRMEEVGREVRSAIRQMYHQRTAAFPMCPEIKKRFEDHKKNRCTANVSPNGYQQRASSSTGQGWFKEILECLLPTSPCEFYDKRITNLEKEICSKFCDQESQYPAPSENICDEVNEWLLEIPISKGESIADKRRREELANSLIVTLETMLILCDDDFEQNAKNVIEKCVHKMPMWYTGTAQERDQFKNQLVETLLKRVLPKPDSRLRDIAKDFVDSLNFNEEVCPNIVIDDIVKKLENFADSAPNGDKEFKDSLIKEIEDILNKLPIRLFGKRNVAINASANNLANEVMDIVKTMSLDSSPKTNRCSLTSSAPCRRSGSQSCCSHTIGCQYEPELKYKKDCICISKSTKVHGKVIKPRCYCPSYRPELRPCDCDCECDLDYYDERIDEAIADWLNNIPVQVYESSEDSLIRERLAKELGDTLKNLSLEDNIIDTVKEVIQNCVYMMPMWNPDNKQNKAQLKQQLVDQLLSKVKPILMLRFKENKEPRFKDQPNEYKDQIKKAIMRDLKRLLDETSLSQYEKDILINKLEDITDDAVAQGQPRAIRNMMEKGIAKLIPGSAIPRHEHQRIIQKMTDLVNENIDDLQSAKDNHKNILNDMIDGIDSQSDLNKKQKNILKNKMADLVTALNNQLMNEDEIRNHMYRIFDESDIPAEIKRDLKDGLEKKLPNEQEQKSRAKESIRRNIVATIENTNIPKEIKKKLKDDIESMLTDHFQKPITCNMLKNAKEGLRQILNNSPISTKDKKELEEKMCKIVEKNMEPLISGSGHQTTKIINDIKAAIDLQDALNAEQKMILKNKIKDLAAGLDGQFMTEDQTRDKVDTILDETDIPKDIKRSLRNKIEGTFPNLQGKKNKAKCNILRDINSVLEDKNFPREIKTKLKEDIERMLKDNFNKSVTSNMVPDVKENLRKNINDAPIATKDKEELEKEIDKIMTNNLESFIADRRGDRTKLLNDMMKEIELQKDLNKDQKRILKNKLADLSVSLEKEFMTEDEFKEKMNKIVDATDLPESVTRNLKNKIEDKIASKDKTNTFIESPEIQCKKMKVKDSILCEVKPPIDKANIPKEVKFKIKDDIKNLVNENFSKPLTPNILKDNYKGVRKIVNEAPIPKKDKIDLGQKLGTIIKKYISPLIADSSLQAHEMLNDIKATIDSQDILDKDQKMVLKRRLADLAASIDGQFLNEDQVKDKVNEIINETDIPEAIKHNLKKEVNIAVLDTKKNKANNDILRDMNLVIEDIDMPEENKDKLMIDIENLLNKNFGKPLTQSTLKYMRDGLQKILKGVPISTKDKTELLQKINGLMENNTKPIYVDSRGEQSTLLDDITAAIDLRLDLDENQKIILKKKVEDLATSAEGQFLSDEEIKKELYEIIDKADILSTVKRKLKNDVENTVPQSKAKLQAKKNIAKDNILRDFESILDNTNMPKEIKEKLTYDIENLINESFNKPITPNKLKHVKAELLDLLRNAPIPKKEKQKLENTLGNVMDNNIKPLITDSNGDRNKILKDIIKEIDLRKDLNEDQKNVLKSNLANLAVALDEQFMTDDELKKEFNQIFDVTDIPESIKRNLKNEVENMVSKDKSQEIVFSESPAIQSKKIKVKDNVLRNINAIIGKTHLPEEVKQELKDKIENVLNENFNKPLTSSILKDTTDGLRKIVNDAPISKEDINELEQKLGRVMEKNTELLLAVKNREPQKNINDVIAVIDLQDDPDDNQKRVVKNVLTDLAESLEGHILTPDQIKEKINKILDETDIPEDIRLNLKKQINNTMSKIKVPQQVKKQAAKNNILHDINSIIDNLNVSEEIKDNLKGEIERQVTGHFNKPVTSRILKDIKDDLLRILKDAPISKIDRSELEQNLGKVMDKTLEPLIADSKGNRTKMLNDIIKDIDLRQDLSYDQKRVLNNDLSDLASLLKEQFMTDDELKEELNQILDATEIPESIKIKLKNEVENMVFKDKSKESPAIQTKKNNTKDKILRDINAIIEKTNLSREVKQELKKVIGNLLNENFNKPLTPSILKDTTKGLRKIVNDAPISKKDKNELEQKVDKVMAKNIEPLIADINREPKKILSDIITAIYLQGELDEDHKMIVKNVLTNLVESLEEQILTPDQIKDKINKALDDTDIPADIRRNLKKQINNMISTLKVPQQDKKEAAKNNILRVINSIIGNSNISEEIKDKLKGEIESRLTDHFNKPVTSRVLKDIKEDVVQILKDATISKKDRCDLEQILHKVMDKTLEPLIADSRGERTKMISDIIKEIDLREDLDEDHKRVLKNELTDLAALLEEQFMTDDELEEEVDKIITNTDIPEDVKSNLKNEIKQIFMTKAPFKDEKELGTLTFESNRKSSRLSNDTVSALGKQGKAYKCNINPIKRNARNVKERMRPTIKKLGSDGAQKPIKFDAKTRNTIFRSIDIIVDMINIPCYNKLYVSDMLKAVADLDAYPDVKKKCVDVILEYIELPAAKEAELRTLLHGLFDECPCLIGTHSRLGTSSYKPLNCYTQTLYHYPALYAFKKKLFNFVSRSRAQDTSCDQSIENIKSVFNYDQTDSKCDNIDFKQINLAIDGLPILKVQKEHAKRKIARVIDEYLSDTLSDDIMDLQDNINNIIENDLPTSREIKADIKKKLGDIILEHTRKSNTDQEIYSSQVYHAASNIKNTERDKRKLDIKGKSSIESQLQESDLNLLPSPENKLRQKVNKTLSNINTTLINDMNKAIIEFILPKHMKAEATITLSNNSGGHFGIEPITSIKIKDIKGQYEVVTNDKYDLKDKIEHKAAKSIETPITLEDFEGKNTNSRKNKIPNKTSPSYSFGSNPGSGSDRANYNTDIYNVDFQDLDLVAAASASMTISSKREKPHSRKINVKDSKMNDSAHTKDNDEEEEISNPSRSDFKGLIQDVVDNKANASPKERSVISTPTKGRRNGDASYETPVTSTPKKEIRGRRLFDEQPTTSTPNKDRRSWDIPDATSIVIADDPYMKSLNPEEIDYWEQIEDAINKWMIHLTIDLDDETRDMLRQQIASDIIDRQQYLQLNPEARKSPEVEFDNLVYQVHRRLNKVLSPEDMKVAIQDGDELMSMMQEVSNRTMVHDTSVEQELHQQVKDAISDTLPAVEDSTAKEQDAFESMKHKLADAFIKMQYTGGKIQNKLKEIIKDDLNKFCDEYSAKHPNKPLDREKLNRELYEALKNLHAPDDIMHSTAEYVHTKDIVDDWVKELPLEDHSATEIKHDIGDLSRKLLDLEHNVDNLNPCEQESKKKNEIIRFLKKIPFKRDQEKNKNRFTKQLLDKLKATEETREVDASARYSITSDDFTTAKGPGQETSYPPCSLNEEDVKFLERIRRRTCLAPKCLSTLIKNKSKSKPLSKSVTSDAQTEISGGISLQTQTSKSVLGYNSRKATREPPFNQEHKSSIRDVRTSYERASNADIPLQPQVIIKEYYWDTNNSFELPTECQTSGSASRRAPCGPTIRPWASPPCTETHIYPRPQQCMQSSRFNPQNSVSFENEEQTRNQPFVSSGWSRACSTRGFESRINGQFSRRERITEGSLNEFRQQTYRERQAKDDGTCAINTEKGYCEDCRVESRGGRANVKEEKPGTVACECVSKPKSEKGKKSTKSRVKCLCNCKDTDKCTQCNGNHILCPFPSYLYFAP